MTGPYSLRQLILLLVIVPVVGIVAVGSWLGLRALEDHLERRLQEDVELVARAIQLPLRDALIRGEEEDVQRALESAFRIGRVYGAAVYDRRGDRIAAAGAVEEVAPAGQLERAAEDGDQREYTEVGQRRVYSFFMPLTTAGGGVMGLLQVTRQRREMEAELRRIRLQAGISVLVGTLLALGVVVVGHDRLVNRPIARLVGSMRTVKEGDRSHRTATGSGIREIDRLAHGLNSMLESVVRRDRDLEQSRRQQLDLQGRLQRSERLAAIGRLAAGVAHELGTPLSVVDGHAQRALRDERLPPAERTRWEEVRREVDRIHGIVQQLLAVGRPDPRERVPVAPERLVRSAVSAAGPELESHDTSLRVASPESPSSIPVAVDRHRVEQALANLLRNAAQAAPGGMVEIGWEVDRERLTFTVDDEGPGIPPAERDLILQPFYTTRETTGGTGLGLTLVQSVAEEHDGTVVVGESPAGGARITLVLRHGEGGPGIEGHDPGSSDRDPGTQDHDPGTADRDPGTEDHDPGRALP